MIIIKMWINISLKGQIFVNRYQPYIVIYQCVGERNTKNTHPYFQGGKFQAFQKYPCTDKTIRKHHTIIIEIQWKPPLPSLF